MYLWVTYQDSNHSCHPQSLLHPFQAYYLLSIITKGSEDSEMREERGGNETAWLCSSPLISSFIPLTFLPWKIEAGSGAEGSSDCSVSGVADGGGGHHNQLEYLDPGYHWAWLASWRWMSTTWLMGFVEIRESQMLAMKFTWWNWTSHFLSES